MADKIYPVTRDGVQFEVRASSKEEAARKAQEANMATMPRIIARGEGNVRVFERPNGQRYVVAPQYSTSDPERVNEILSGLQQGRSGAAGEVSRRAIDEQLIADYPIAARAGEFVRGAPILGSRLDEALGVARGPEATAGARALSGAMQRQRPGQTLGLNLAGGLAGTALAGGLLAPTKVGQGLVRLGQQVVGQGSRLSRGIRAGLAGGALGGIEGALYGSGEGTTGEERLREAASQGAIGAGFGGLLGGAGPIIADASQNVIGSLRRSDIATIARTFNISTDAAKVIKNTFDQGGDIQAALQNIQRAGDEGMLADAGVAAQALLDATAQSGGAAGQVVRDQIADRMSRTNQALDVTLDTALGPAPLGPRTALTEIAERSAPARTDAYNLAYGRAIDYSGKGRQIEEVLSRIEPEVISQAIKEANAQMLADKVVNQQIMARIAADGTVEFVKMPNVQQLDELKKALQRLAYSPSNIANPMTGKLTGTGQRYNSLASQLRDAVADAVPEYGRAVAIGGDKLAEERAFMLGRTLLRAGTEIEDVMLELGKKPSADQLAAAKSGLRSYISKTLGDVRAIASDPSADALEARQVVRAVTDMSSDNARRKIRELMGAEADALLSQIDQAAQSAVVRAAMAQNSKTFARQAVDRTVDEIIQPNIVEQAGSGEMINTTKALVQAVTGMTGEYTAARRQRIYQDLARALTEKRGAEAETALRVLDAAMRGQQLTDQQTTTLANLIASALYGSGTPALTRGLAAEERQGAQ